MKLNGNLVLNSDATGEIQNVYIHKVNPNPAFNSAEKGRIVFNTGNATYYFNDGSAWVSFATGGNAAALLAEVDAIEASIGAAVGGNGTYNQATFTGVPIISGAADLTAALKLLADKANATDTLAELLDVSIPAPASGQYLKYDSTASKWIASTLVVANITDLNQTGSTVTAAQIINAASTTSLTSELNQLGGVTSNVQTQLNNKQPLDAGLTALAAFNANGIIVQTAADTWAARSLVAPAAGVTITNPDGVAGAPSFALADDLAALEGLTGTGYAVRTGTSTWINRSITGQAGRIAIANGDGVSTNTDIDLALVTDGATGTFLKFTRDVYGRVAGTTAVTTADITALVDATYVNSNGDTMTGTLTFSSGTVTGIPTPTAALDAANKSYVDAVAAGLSWKQAVRAASTVAGGNLTLATTTTVDGVALVSGDRVLVKNQTNATENGIYLFNGTGLTSRSPDMDAAAEFAGATLFVTEGAVNGDTGWTQTAEVVSLGTTPVAFYQFSGSATYSWGIGLGMTGNQIDVNLGAGIAELPSDGVGIDLFNTVNALRLTTDGVTPSTDTNSKLTLALKTSGGLTQDTNGLYVPALGITNAMLLNSAIGLNADTGTGTLALGSVLLVQGSAASGIVTAASGQTVVVSALDAAYAQKGVAQFDAGDFSVTTGTVSIKAGGVDNTQLANSTISVNGTTGGAQAIALGTTVNFVGGTAPITTVSSAGQVAINVADATATAKGLASFSSADFTVSSGAVSAVAKPLDSLTDVTISTASAGQTIVYSAGSTQFVNRPTYFLYNGAESSSHVVSHSLGQQYCNVTVVETASNEVVIPQSIVFDSATQLTVTFTSALACKVVVMGVNAA
jgi:hypothetical protein